MFFKRALFNCFQGACFQGAHKSGLDTVTLPLALGMTLRDLESALAVAALRYGRGLLERETALAQALHTGPQEHSDTCT